MKIIKLLLLSLLLAGCKEAVTLPPDGFVAQAVLSTDTLHVGDPVTLTLTARHPVGSVVRFPTIGKGKEVVVRGRSSDTSERAEGSLETEEIYQLTSLRTGSWVVTTNPVVCTFSDGTEKAQALPKMVLRIESTLTDATATKLTDIKAPVTPPLRIPRWAWVPALIVLLALVAGFVTLLLMKRPKAMIGSEPGEPPQITAKKALDALRNEAWIPEPFFVRLSLILRTYLEDRFDLDAPESTTEELAGKLEKDLRLTPESRIVLRNVFTQADLVKFARAGAEQDVMHSAFNTVEQFVEQTAEEVLPQESTKTSKFDRPTPLSKTLSVLLSFASFALFRG